MLKSCTLDLFKIRRTQIFPRTYKFFIASFLFCQCFSTKILVAQVWNVIGSEQDIASEASSFTHIATQKQGNNYTPYIIFTEAGILKVKKLMPDSSWQQFGNPVFSGNATYSRLYIFSNDLYASYIDVAAGNRLAIKKYASATQTWEPLNGNTDNLFVSEGSVTYSIGQFNTTPRSSMTFDLLGNPIVAFADGAAFTPFVKKFSGSTWETIGGGEVSGERAVGINIAYDSAANEPYIVYIQQGSPTATTGPLRVYRFTAGSWQNIAVPSPVSGGSAATGATSNVRHSALAFDKDWNLYVAYFNTSSNNRATAIKYTKASSSWSFSGILSGRDAPGISMIRDDRGNVMASFIDVVSNNSGRSLGRVFVLAAGQNTWGELKNETSASGIDEPVGNFTIAAGGQYQNPFVAYTKNNTNSINTPIVQVFTYEAPNGNDDTVYTPKQMEKLNRGIVAIRTNAVQVYVGWRLLGTDVIGTAFNVYRNGVKINLEPITQSTNFLDNTQVNGEYYLRPVINGEESDPTETASVIMQPYLEIALQKPADGVTPDGIAYSYSPNDCSVGDMDGDGQYEIVVKWDPGNSKDNAQSGYTGNVYLDAYRLDGTRLWRIDLGRNIRAGAHYTQFMVYDFDGDGKAEIACKTADGTIDGQGVVIGDANADYRNGSGYVLSGPEFLTIFNGLTGAAMATTNYLPARGSVAAWGDGYGNRVDRFTAAVAYLDGARPSLIMGRGYYTRLVRVAWDWRDGQLTHRWTFDSDRAGNSSHSGQGNHQMSVGDIDGDGKDEITNGSSTQNNNGLGSWANGLGHGDALHMTDIDPDRPGLEIWMPHESPASNGQIGAALLDAKTGVPIFTVPVASDDVGRAMAADIDPRHKGLEMWASRGGLYNAKGVQIGTAKPSMNFGIWWDADTTRELLDNITISKWNYLTNTSNTVFTATGFASNNGTKATPNLTADIFGDWREELILRSTDNTRLRIFTTTEFTENRFYTLMHDPQYRTAIAWQNSAYNQPPHPGFYLGHGMLPQPVANIFIAGAGNPLPLQWLQFTAKNEVSTVVLNWNTAAEVNTHLFMVEKSLDGTHFTSLGSLKAKGNNLFNQYQFTDKNPVPGTTWYRIKQVDKDGKFSYSSIQLVQRATQYASFQLFPNPAISNQLVQLKYTGNNASALNLQVTSITGTQTMKVDGNINHLNISINRWLQNQPAGLYIITLNDGANSQTLKLLKQ